MVFRSSDKSQIAVLPVRQTRPVNIEYKVLTPHAANTAQLQLKLMNPGDYLTIDFLLLNPLATGGNIVAELGSRIVNLSNVTNTNQDLQEDTTNYYRNFFLVCFIPIVAIAAVLVQMRYPVSLWSREILGLITAWFLVLWALQVVAAWAATKLVLQPFAGFL